MTSSFRLVLICLMVLVGLGIIFWMMIVNLRDRKNASEIVAMEVAVCIQKANGDLLIRQRRGKSLLGLLIGLSLASGSLAIVIAQIRDTTAFWLETLEVTFFGLSLLVLGGFVTWVSGRGFREPHVTINSAGRIIQFRHGLRRNTQTWAFGDIRGVTKQSGFKKNLLLTAAEYLVTSGHMGQNMNRTLIGLQHVDGRVLQIGTATQQAARRVPELIASALGKPVLKME